MTLGSDIFAHCVPSGQLGAKAEPSPEDKATQPQKRNARSKDPGLTGPGAETPVWTEPEPAVPDAHGSDIALNLSQQAPLEARSHPGRTTSGQEFCSLLSARRAQLAAIPHAGVQRIARKASGGRHVSDVTSEDHPHGMSSEGPAGQTPASDLHGAGQSVPPKGPVNQRKRLLELFKMVPQGTPPDPRREQGTTDPHENAEQPPRSDVRHHHPAPGSCPSGHHRRGHLDPLSLPARIGHHQSGRLLNEGGRPTEATPGQGAGPQYP